VLQGSCREQESTSLTKRSSILRSRNSTNPLRVSSFGAWQGCKPLYSAARKFKLGYDWNRLSSPALGQRSRASCAKKLGQEHPCPVKDARDPGVPCYRSLHVRLTACNKLSGKIASNGIGRFRGTRTEADYPTQLLGSCQAVASVSGVRKPPGKPWCWFAGKPAIGYGWVVVDNFHSAQSR
jgi:hypothetical protein